MKKNFKTIVGLGLALAITFTAMPQTVQAGAKITRAQVGSTKKVQAKLYKGAPAHKAKVKFNSMVYMGTANGLNIYSVDFELKNTKLSQNEANGISRETRKKNLSSWNSYTCVLTDSNGSDISGVAAIAPTYSTITNSSSNYTKKSNYRVGYRRYIDTIYYPKSIRYKLYVGVPVYETDVYVGIAGLSKGQPSSSKSLAYKSGNITFTGAGYGKGKKNIVAIRLQ